MEVFSPSSKNLQVYITNRLLVYVYREFRAAEKRGAISWVRADGLSAQFPNISEFRHYFAEETEGMCCLAGVVHKLNTKSHQKDANGHLFWSKKRDFVIPSEEELKKLVWPENVALANILEDIVDTLRSRIEVSYLFLIPVSKKEAPDCLQVVERPMDLSTIREKARKLEYKS